MTVNLSKTFLTFSARMLLVAASVMSSDARPHANRHEPISLELRTRFPADNGSDLFGFGAGGCSARAGFTRSAPHFAHRAGHAYFVLKRIGVDAACRLMVTGSDDKTARVWALPEGRGNPELLRTLRVPIGEGHDGKIFAVALSPNGKWVAAGGWDARYSIDKTMAVYIFDASTGRLVTRLGGFSTHSKASRFFAGRQPPRRNSGSREGMRLWEAPSWRLLAEDRDYDGKDAYGAAFDGANRLYTVAYDGQIRRYSAAGHLEAKALPRLARSLSALPCNRMGRSSPLASAIRRR